MTPLMGPVGELSKRRFDRKCKRVATGAKKPITVRMAAGILVVSALIFVCLGAEVVRESTITVAAEQKAQLQDGGSSLKDENPDYAGWLTVEGTSISTPVVSCRKGDPKLLSQTRFRPYAVLFRLSVHCGRVVAVKLEHAYLWPQHGYRDPGVQ